MAAVATVARFPVWALVDEAAHFDYVERIAEDARLPVLDKDPVHREVLAVPALAAVRIPSAERRPALAVLVLPLVAGVLLTSVSLVVEIFDAFYGRVLCAHLATVTPATV